MTFETLGRKRSFAAVLITTLLSVGLQTSSALPATRSIANGKCPMHTIRTLVEGQADDQCACARGDDVYCTGPLCRLGQMAGSSGFVQAFPSKCTECDCKFISQAQRAIVPISTMDSHQVYYHVHISKTGGTTLEHVLQQLPSHPSIPEGVTLCATEKHPFSHPPLFADPAELEKSQCNIITAEGRLAYVDQQIPYTKPHLIVLLRHPVLRTLSQFQHDRIKERTKVMTETWRGTYTAGHDNIADLYKDETAFVHPRYKDWQLLLLTHPNFTYPDALSQMTFVGITEYYRTTLCLFYFTFQMSSLLYGCQQRPLPIYNKACQGENCSFQNQKPQENMVLEDNHQKLREKLAEIPAETKYLIEQHTRKDQELYDAALDLFWRRVAVMEAVVGERFTDLPDSYRHHPTRGNSMAIFKPVE
eukprot:m.112160 g.112160  ORF g.112160 m.112160 type:complete len:418 (-) comp15317_c0_seq2:93-1346(-)